jgi:hypothetical protein
MGEDFRWLKAIGQKGRVRIGVWAFALVPICVVGYLFARSREWLLFWFVIWGMCILCLVVVVPITKCPVCHEWILEWALKQKSHKNSLHALRALEACPNCGAISKDDKPWLRPGRVKRT